jgi:hypothetical protein
MIKTDTRKLPVQERVTTTDKEIRQSIGTRIGGRVVLKESATRLYTTDVGTKVKKRYVLALCDCGEVSEVFWSSLKHGRADSCHKCAINKRGWKKRIVRNEQAK